MSSSTAPAVDQRTIEVEPGFLPAPATKLVITQYLEHARDGPHWACIIVGAFYDHNDVILWSTELFAGYLNIDPDYVDDGSTSETSNSESEVTHDYSRQRDDPVSDLAYHSETNDARHRTQQITDWLRLQQQRTPSPPPPRLIQPQQVAYSNWNSPPTSWNPTHHGQVPGYWQASFNPDLHRWVHTWQPLC